MKPQNPPAHPGSAAANAVGKPSAKTRLSPGALPPSRAKPTAKRRRLSAKAQRRLSFAELCEATGGRAVAWRRLGCTEAEIRAFMYDSPFILFEVVPTLHEFGLSEAEVLRHVPHDRRIAAAILFVYTSLTANPFRRSRRTNICAVSAWTAATYLRMAATRGIAAMKNKAARGLHYEAEKAKRRAMAAERRRITRRTTMNPCPTKEQVLEAWRHARDSKESLVSFGSIIQDLECYVDNSLRRDEYGTIIGRNAGVKGWLHDNLPELYAHYTTVIRYKAAAKKLRQIVGLADPTPVEKILPASDKGKGAGNVGLCNYGVEKLYATKTRILETGKRQEGNTAKGGCSETTKEDAVNQNANYDCPSLEIVRARAIYLEAMEGVPDVTARVLARIDALCDPERTDEAAMLRSWREKYNREITVRRKDAWWKRLMKKESKRVTA